VLNVYSIPIILSIAYIIYAKSRVNIVFDSRTGRFHSELYTREYVCIHVCMSPDSISILISHVHHMCPILLADSFTYASFDVHVTSHIDVIYI